jgi:U32 family peptidase
MGFLDCRVGGRGLVRGKNAGRLEALSNVPKGNRLSVASVIFAPLRAVVLARLPFYVYFLHVPENSPVNIAHQTAPHACCAPELLAPAGDWACVHAAVENGADAVYFGLDRFNARMRADNFTLLELPALMQFLHERGVKGYLAFNTLVFADEMRDAAAFLREAIAAGIDAAIVQDIGLCRLIRRVSADFPIHASTQMTITSAAGVEMAKELGAKLVVVARECSVKEIGAMKDALGPSALPMEAFVHGALCVAYSGQCLTSESLGGRSANRGECAQACRLPYELIADGKVVQLGLRKYLLSPRDLAGLELVPAMLRAGVVSFKIEGRLKTPEYVANITRVYREAMDAALAATSPETADRAAEKLRSAKSYDMEMAFSRGLYTGWLKGTDNKALVHAQYPKKRGVRLGKVMEVKGARVRVGPYAPSLSLGKPSPEDAIPVAQGDGVVFDIGHPEGDEAGGFVTTAEPAGREVWLTFHYPSVRWAGVRVGAVVWKTSDPALDKRLRATYADEKVHFTRPVNFFITGAEGLPLKIAATDELGNTATAESAMVLVAATEKPLDDAKLAAQLSRLGGSPFHLGRLDNKLHGGLMLPVSELNKLRRAVIDELVAKRRMTPKWTVNAPSPEDTVVACEDVPLAVKNALPVLIPMVRDMTQLDAVLPLSELDIYAEFEDHKAYREAMTRTRAYRDANGGKGPMLFAAPPRIFKDSEKWILDIIASAEPDGILVRNAEHMRYFKGKRLRGDYSLNVANHLAAEFFIREKRLEGITASCDLNVEQLAALLKSAPTNWLEITLHQHMPMFHMEHCVFCAFLSDGHDFHDCGRPCEKKRVYLRDRTGAEHYLRADAGCRNTVFNSRAQTGADYAKQLMELGARRFRIEFLEESPTEIANILERYNRLLKGEVDGASIWRDFKLVNQIGVTRGTLK